MDLMDTVTGLRGEILTSVLSPYLEEIIQLQVKCREQMESARNVCNTGSEGS